MRGTDNLRHVRRPKKHPAKALVFVVIRVEHNYADIVRHRVRHCPRNGLTRGMKAVSSGDVIHSLNNLPLGSCDLLLAGTAVGF